MKLAIVASFVVVAAGAYFIGQRYSSVSTTLSLTPTEQEELRSLHLTRLTPEGYLMYQSLLHDITLNDSPEAALQKLRDLIREGVVRKDCNNLTYQIGLAAFERYKSIEEATSHVDQLCGYGAFHGVLGAYFTAEQPPLSEARKICDDFAVNREKMECYHAVGHSSMEQTLGDVSASVNLCNLALDETATAVCGLGIFHELFQPHVEHHVHEDGDLHSHHSKIASSEEALAICKNQSEPFRRSCYKLAPRKYLADFPNGVADVFTWCVNAGDAEAVTACTRGAIGDVMQYVYRYETLENICRSGTREQILPCISEIVFNKLSYTDPKSMADVCQKEFTHSAVREACLYAIAAESRN